MIVIVYSVANGIEAVVVADVKAIAEVDYVCNAFTSDALYFIAWEAECEVVSDFLRHNYIACCWCWSGCFYCCGSCLCFRHCVRRCVFCNCVETND